VSIRSVPSGNRVVTIELPPEECAPFEAALDVEVMRAPAGTTEPGATLRHQRADAFIRLLGRRGSSRDASADASAGGARPELILHRRVFETTLADGTPLPPSVARRLTCDADVRVMTHWPDGSPADVGRRHRLVTPRLRRLVIERAGGVCEHDRCTARHFLDVHHVVHWDDHGPTDLANLRLLCGVHHQRVHEAP
jgi:hypothetical protein